MQVADNIVKLAKELGVARGLLYQWEASAQERGWKTRKKRAGPTAVGESATETELRQEVGWLREALARKVKEADFFKGALQRVEAGRQSKGSSGAVESTPKSGK
jgi:transposase-like protein